MVAEDLYKHRRYFELRLDRELGKLFPEDREKVREFLSELIARGYTFARVNRYMYTICTQAERLGVPYSKATEGDIKAWLVRLQKTKYSPWTKHTVLVQVRAFLKWLGKDDLAKWIKPQNPKRGKLPEEILTEEDIRRIAEAAYTTRDRAFVLALYESGCRIGEFLPLKLKHVAFDRYGAVLRLDGKTGTRRVRIVGAAVALQRWIEEHPQKGNPDAYLWCRLPTPNNPKWVNRHLSYQVACRILRELAAKAGVKKRVSPHAFRHARATHLAKILTEAQMKEYFGWVQDSDMAATYVHLSGRDVDNAILGAYGIKEAEESSKPQLLPRTCPRCNETNDPASRFCQRCGLPLDKSFLVEEGSLEERLARLEEELRTLAEVKDALAEIRELASFLKGIAYGAKMRLR